MLRNTLVSFFILVLLTSCKEKVKQLPEVKVATTTMEEKKLVPFDNPATPDSQLPRLFSTGSELYFSWVTETDSLASLHYSEYQNGIWSPANNIINGQDWFNNWADFPAIASKEGHILTNILQKSADGTYTYDVKLNLYNSEENTWKHDFILHNDGTKSEHGFVSILPTDADDFFVTWLDGRETVGKGHGGGQMTLRGAFVDYNGQITGDTQLDDRVCDCCQTSAAWTPNGPIVAYRDRSNDEIRDISVVRAMDGKWQAPVTVGSDRWKIAGCPVNGPSIAAFNETVAIAWFTAAKDEGDVLVAFSKDAGATFSPSYRIDAGDATGRVDITMLNETEAVVIWMQPMGEAEVIYLMKINDHGYTGQPVAVTETSAERASGFPQLERVGDNLFLAWTVIETDKKPSIKTAQIEVAKL